MLLRIAGVSLLVFASLPAFLQSFKWEDHRDCVEGRQQSPIDIRIDEATPHPLTKPVQFFNYRPAEDDPNQISISRDYDKWLSNLKIHHTGHTVRIDIPTEENFVIQLDQVPGHIYRLLQIHFHWGSHDNEGSEHTIDGVMSPLEIHFVHKLEKSVDKGEHVNQLTVLGVFAQYQSCHQEPRSLRRLIHQVADILDPKSSVHMKHKFNPYEILPEPEKRRNFFFYNGSLTTPPCSETVNWIVYPDPIAISPCSVRQLRQLISHDKKKLEKNYRPVQQLHQRNVKFAGSTLPSESVLESSLSVEKLLKCRCEKKPKDLMTKEDFERQLTVTKGKLDENDSASAESAEFQKDFEEEVEVEVVSPQQSAVDTTSGAINNHRSLATVGLAIVALNWLLQPSRNA